MWLPDAFTGKILNKNMWIIWLQHSYTNYRSIV